MPLRLNRLPLWDFVPLHGVPAFSRCAVDLYAVPAQTDAGRRHRGAACLVGLLRPALWSAAATRTGAGPRNGGRPPGLPKPPGLPPRSLPKPLPPKREPPGPAEWPPDLNAGRPSPGAPEKLLRLGRSKPPDRGVKPRLSPSPRGVNGRSPRGAKGLRSPPSRGVNGRRSAVSARRERAVTAWCEGLAVSAFAWCEGPAPHRRREA